MLPKLQDALNSGAYARHYIFELVHHCWTPLMTDELLDRLREAEDKFNGAEEEVIELAKKLPYMW